VTDRMLHVEPGRFVTEAELREALAPRIAAKIMARAPSLGLADAEQLAHEILAIAAGAFLGAHSALTPIKGPDPC